MLGTLVKEGCCGWVQAWNSGHPTSPGPPGNPSRSRAINLGDGSSNRGGPEPSGGASVITLVPEPLLSVPGSRTFCVRPSPSLRSIRPPGALVRNTDPWGERWLFL